MAEIDDIPRTYDEAVTSLARSHGEGGPGDLQIYHFPDPLGETVRLLEVSDAFQESGEIRALPVGRSRDYPFRSAVALATQEEWQKAQAGQIDLPAGWDTADARRVWP